MTSVFCLESDGYEMFFMVWVKPNHDDFSPPIVGSEGPGWGFLFARSDVGK
jgi:hypothetical protein